MGKKEEVKKANIRTLEQAPEKKVEVEAPHDEEVKGVDELAVSAYVETLPEKEKDGAEKLSDAIDADLIESYALNDLIASAEELLCDPGLVYEGAVDDTHPLAIAKKTLQRFIDRLKATNVADN